jgi:hypothetical protein
MSFLIRFLLLCLMPMAGWAQSSLPPCPTDANARRHNCYGALGWPSGEKYVGEWRYDDFNGRGTFTWPNGDKYVGEFKDRKMNGTGAFTRADGAQYVGEYPTDTYQK